MRLVLKPILPREGPCRLCGPTTNDGRNEGPPIHFMTIPLLLTLHLLLRIASKENPQTAGDLILLEWPVSDA